MSRILLTFILLIFVQSLFSQNISVASFKSLPTDLDARVNFPKKDQNGDVCAIIKVVTTETGFSWDGDQLGITKIEKKTGEYWLYVPFGAKKLTIKHDHLGVLRDYRYEEAIQKATVYELILVSGKVATTVIPVAPVWLTIRSNAEGADIYINGVLKGITPLAVKLMPGKYTYRVEKSMYRKNAGAIEISGKEKEEKKDLFVELLPAFGTVKINSLPETGATVLIDDVETGKSTPFVGEQIKSGTHLITIKKNFFQPKSIEVIVKDGETTEHTITLASIAANVTISTQPSADIFIDGKFIANGSYQGKIPAGVSTFEARKEGYYPDKKDQDISVGETVSINLAVQPKLGSMDVVSNPMDAKVFLNGQEKGITPLTLQDLTTGDYELKLEKKGFAPIVKTITIAENKTTEVNEKLSVLGKDSKSETIKPNKEENRQAPPITLDKPIYPPEYYKYKKSKTVWLVSAMVTASAGTYTYLQAGNYYTQYKSATTEADALQTKVKTFDTIYPICFALAGASTLGFILQSKKQGKVKSQTLGVYPRPVFQGAGLGLVYNF
ncbi:MAG: PEGA domain-containing protein [Prolixibacteraceae bacterium]